MYTLNSTCSTQHSAWSHCALHYLVLLLLQLLRYTRWGGTMVDATLAARYGSSPFELATDRVDPTYITRSGNRLPATELSRLVRYHQYVSRYQKHGYRCAVLQELGSDG